MLTNEFLWRSILIGTGATALMDVWALFLHFACGNPLPNWGLVGRWFCHLTGGKVFHDDIAVAAPWPNELAIGWIAHYAIGILYAGILLVLAGPEWAAAPTFLPAWILGLVTVGAGWFLLQPGMGAGWAASKRPNAKQIRLLNIAAHTVFAAGLYGTARLIA
ncbi:MAG: DUF2938 domain-containing protein [Proteobacteria bacterium]|nr:DUF2938 domain-containing protein [Pseudomonadota bacterium]